METQKVITFRSNQRFGGTSGNYVIGIFEQVFTYAPQKVKLISACIPNTWYNVLSQVESAPYANNTVRLIEDFPSVGANTYDIEIPPGPYNSISFGESLQVEMNKATTFTDNYTVLFNINSGKYVIKSTNGPFRLNFLQAFNMHRILGFDNIQEYSSTTSAPYTLESIRMSRIVPDCDILFKTDLISGVDNGEIPFIETPTSDQILASIPITVGKGGLLVYNAPRDVPFYELTNSAFSNLFKPNLSSPQLVKIWLEFPNGFPIILEDDWQCRMLIK